MLSYAFTTLNQGGYEDVATEEFENIHNRPRCTYESSPRPSS